MDISQLPVHLQAGVRAFSLRFDNLYHQTLLRAHLLKLGYKSVEVLPEDVTVLAGRSQLFQKTCYWCPYDADAWKAFQKRQPASIVIMVASDKRIKNADEWQGPSEIQILTELQQDLNKRGYTYNADAWKLLVDAYRNQEGKIDDPKAIWHLAYSLGLQTEGAVDLAAVRSVVGWKAAIYDLQNCLLSKNKRGALQAMFVLVNDHEAVQMCMGLQKMLADLMDCQSAIKQGKNSETYAAERKLHPFRAQKMFQQANQVPQRVVVQLAQSLMTMELELKKTSSLTLTERFKNRLMHFLDQP
jgi:hypothetical protein